jgi:Type VI secretion system (T6SS), amidase effector protein 4
MPTFAQLWTHHPYPNSPCDTTAFPNQCAIRMTVALHGAGIKTKNLHHCVHCWHGHTASAHILRAQELANALAKQSALIGCLFVSSAFANPPPISDAAIVGGQRYNLSQDAQGKCKLSGDNQALPLSLDLTGPCVFLRRGSKKGVSQHRYPKQGTVFFVVAAPSALSRFKDQSSIKESDRCSDQAQAVVVRASKTMELRTSKKEGLFCPNMGLDEKDFYSAAHETKSN